MARPRKWRQVCCLPENSKFGPIGGSCDQDTHVVMSVDEYETIRLIDLQGFTQEQCAEQMNIARTTAQTVYNSARLKLAQCLVNTKQLHIQGGNFVLCDGNADKCRCSCPRKQGCKHKNNLK